MSFKKSLCLCAGILLFLSTGTASANASGVKPSHTNNNGKITRMTTHLNNVKRIQQIKMTHAHNVHKINRIKRHIINHQKNLIKLSKRINRAQRHHHDVDLINQLNNDKTRLIKAIENNERGMLRLAEQVTNEEHQINLVRHPQAQSSTTIHLPSVKPNSDYSTSKSAVTFINEVNGKLTKYGAKDANSWSNGHQSKSREYSDLNGKYSATPDQINQDEINQLNQQIQYQMQDSNSWFKEVNQEMNREFDSIF